MARKTIELTLIGPREGFTGFLRGYSFRNGRATITGDSESVEGVAEYLRRCYNAHKPEFVEQARVEYKEALEEAIQDAEEAGDDKKLGKLRKELEAKYGNSQAHEGPRSRSPEQVQGDVQEERPDSSEASADDVKGGDNSGKGKTRFRATRRRQG